MGKIIDGKTISAKERELIASERERFTAQTGVVPGLSVIIVGEDPASQIYVRNKEKACREAGFNSKIYRLPSDTQMEELLSLVDKLSKDDTVHGILVQTPLPSHLNEDEVINRIPPQKDVDAFHPVNVGKIMLGCAEFLPCTPAGVMKMLQYEGIEVSGKHCVVVGRSNIVGKPMAQLLLQQNGTVTICHSRTKNLTDITRLADILVVAVGKSRFIKPDMIKPGAVVIDVGMNRGEDGKLTGDVDFELALSVASYITPVPGGVGLMTVTMLLRNTLTAAIKSVSEQKHVL